MGKYMRKSKLASEVSSIEMLKSTAGVRTRAKTLALQHLRDLQLRSRRLEKPPLVVDHKKQSSKVKQSTPLEGKNRCNGNQVEQFGENDLEFQSNQRATRESTPCNLITDVDNISTPGSSTKYPSLAAENLRTRSSILTNIPTTREMDELFAHFEQQQQRIFMEKYNFDIINDMPLPGRFEWVKVNP